MGKGCCSSDHGVSHDNIKNAIASILVPSYFDDSHSPIGAVSIDEVEELVRVGLLSECDVGQVYQYNGQALGIMCCDPSVGDHKRKILSKNGNMTILSWPGLGLRFDPGGMYGERASHAVDEIARFVQGEAGSHFGFKAVVFGAHYPCGASGEMSLKEVCCSVAAGARYLRSTLGLEMRVTIFINTKVILSEHLSPQYALLWMDINPDAQIE